MARNLRNTSVDCSTENGHEGQADQGEFPVQERQDDGDGDQANQHIQRAHHTQVDEPPDLFDISGGFGHEVAGMFGIMEGKAQMLQLVIEEIAQIVGDLLR